MNILKKRTKIINEEWSKLMIRRFKRFNQSYHYCECAGCGNPIITFIRKPRGYEFCSDKCREIVLSELSTYK